MKKTLQTRNILIEVIEKAEKRALNDGLSSVQDAVRLLLTQYANGNLKISVSETATPNMIKLYRKEDMHSNNDLKAGKSKVYNNADSMMNDLKN